MNRLELKGIDGTNPLGFLAAMGAFRVATLAQPGADTRMGWHVDVAAPTPFLESGLTDKAFAEAVCREAKRIASEVASYNDIIKTTRDHYRSEALKHIPSTSIPTALTDADYFAAFASDGVVDKDGEVEPTLLSFSNKGSGQNLFKDFIALTTQCDTNDMYSAIILAEHNFKPITNLNWEPTAFRPYALRWMKPEYEEKQTNVPLHILAFLGLSAFPSMPIAQHITTVGFDYKGKAWAWIIWPSSISYSAAIGLIRTPTDRRFAGTIRMISRRFSSNKRFYFSPAAPYEPARPA